MSSGSIYTVSYNHKILRKFRNVPYEIHCFVETDVLKITLENITTADRWLGEFTSHALEEMTYKTGSLKKFPTLIKMLASGLAEETPSVTIDVLTVSDLNELRASKNGGQPAAMAGDEGSTGKRYIILTYLAEFDTVHYPLPLKPELSPDTKRLKQVIGTLRTDLDKAKMELTQLREKEAANKDLNICRSCNGDPQNELNLKNQNIQTLTHEIELYDMENKKLRQLLRAVTIDNQNPNHNHNTLLSPEENEIHDLKLRLTAAADAVDSLGIMNVNPESHKCRVLEEEITKLTQQLEYEKQTNLEQNDLLKHMEQDQSSLLEELEHYVRVNQELNFQPNNHRPSSSKNRPNNYSNNINRKNTLNNNNNNNTNTQSQNNLNHNSNNHSLSRGRSRSRVNNNNSGNPHNISYNTRRSRSPTFHHQLQHPSNNYQNQHNHNINMSSQNHQNLPRTPRSRANYSPSHRRTHSNTNPNSSYRELSPSITKMVNRLYVSDTASSAQRLRSRSPAPRNNPITVQRYGLNRSNSRFNGNSSLRSRSPMHVRNNDINHNNNHKEGYNDSQNHRKPFNAMAYLESRRNSRGMVPETSRNNVNTTIQNRNNTNHRLHTLQSNIHKANRN